MFEGWDGETARGSADEVRRPLDRARPVLAGPVGDAARSLAGAEVGTAHLVRASEPELADRLDQLNDLRAVTERVTVAVVLEAANRGCHLDSGLSLHDWLARRCPWLARAEVADLVTVARHLDHPAHDPIKTALAQGSLPVRRPARLLRALRQVQAVTDPDTYEADVAVLLPVAQDAGYTDAELKKVTDHLIATALPDRDTEAKEKAQRDLRGVHESSLANGSLVRFIVTADPEGAATIRAVLTSPLAAPTPDDDGTPDPRTATQRRYDALLTVIGRGVASPDGTPTTSKARVVITMDYDVLTGQLAGLGHTMTGESFTPATVRRMACTAEIIPAVLGTDSETLDLGRAARLASPAQHLTLWARDRHCTYPGCTVPPQWCDAHHAHWWSRGGTTDLDNLALLCGRHHTLVHDRDHTATIDTTGVTWHV